MATRTYSSPAASAVRLPASGSSRVNVGQGERIASAALGSALTLFGLSRFSFKGLLMAATGGILLYRGTTGHCPAFSAAGISTAPPQAQPAPVQAATTITVAQPREAVYDAWRDVERFPHFMEHLHSVQRLGHGRTFWQAAIPGNLGTLDWEATVTEDRAGGRVAWRSEPGADVDNRGSVTFHDAPGGETEVRVDIQYRPPVGALGHAASRLLTPVFEQMVKEDVRRFKRLIETGEIPTTEGQPSGPVE